MSETPAPEIITITMPSRLEHLAILDRLVLAVCERLDLGEDFTSQLSMSVIEAGTNAVQHGNGKNPDLPFDTRFLLYPDRVEVEVTDRGKGFDLAKVKGDITSPEHIFDMRGRGIFIMRSCCDSVEFTFGPSGTRCRLVKSRAVAAQPAADA